jgi:hypothetical protein
MPSLRSLLRTRTLLLSAQPRADYVPRHQMEPTQGFGRYLADAPHNNWAYTMQQPESGPPFVEGFRIGVLHPGMHLDTVRSQTVCERIDWRNPRVWLPGMADAIELELRPRFLLGFHDGAGGGTLPSTWPSPYFTLPTTMQCGTQYVYGYRLDGGSLLPFAENDARADDTAIMIPETGTLTVSASAGSTTPVTSYEHICIIVAVSLVTTEPRNDFEPTGAAWMSRFYPMVTVVANTTLAKVEASLRLIRPAISPMGDMPQMGRRIGTLLHADRNDFSLGMVAGRPTVIPEWDRLFDYFLSTDVPYTGSAPPNRSEVFAAVHHTHDGQGRAVAGAASRSRTIRGQRATWQSVASEPRAFVGTGEYAPTMHFEYVPTPVVKLPGQGEFDNIHLAPPMMGTLNGAPRPIAMAPLCAHDCFHMHWRWGERFEGRGQAGFSDPTPSAPLGVPNSSRGRPMVPRNQDVVIALVDGRGIDYRVRCHGPIAPFEPQVAMHHGGAYALYVESIPEFGSVTLGDLARRRVGGGYPGFYHYLRFREEGSGYAERIHLTGTLDALRETNLRPTDL